MARRPTLKIDGVTFTNVYEVSYELYTERDDTGRPSDRAHAGVIKVIRESDDNVDIARWAMDSAQTNWKDGEVLFRKPDDADMKTLRWSQGFITRYEERVPHIRNEPDAQVYEYFEISCQRLEIGDAEIDNRWTE